MRNRNPCLRLFMLLLGTVQWLIAHRALQISPQITMDAVIQTLKENGLSEDAEACANIKSMLDLNAAEEEGRDLAAILRANGHMDEADALDAALPSAGVWPLPKELEEDLAKVTVDVDVKFEMAAPEAEFEVVEAAEAADPDEPDEPYLGNQYALMMEKEALKEARAPLKDAPAEPAPLLKARPLEAD